MIRIGVINIDTSHPLTFAKQMVQGDRARYVAVYNDSFRGDDELDAFINTFGLEKRCESVEELAECVDIGFIQGCDWDKHLDYVEPFFALGKPVFIDKPIVGNMKDIAKLEEYVEKGAIILGSSSVRYCYEIAEFLAIPEEERGEIVNIYGTSGVDEFNYGIHIVEAIGGLMGTGAMSCKFVSRATIGEKTCDTYSVLFGNGVTATYALFSGTWHPFTLTIQTTKRTYQMSLDTKNLYIALLDRIFTYMETKKETMASMDALIESIKIALAGKISRETSGCEVTLSEIPAGYEGYDGKVFADGYALTSKKIYLI